VIPAAFVQDLLTRVDIVELVGRTVQLKKAGINFKGLCPFHGEKSPSFIVSPSRQTYHCFGCGVHGDAIRFLVEQHGMTFPDAVRDLAQQVGMQVPEDDATPEERAEAARKREQSHTLTDLLARASDHYRAQLKASPRAVGYLKGRGLSGEIAARFGLGYAPEGWRTLAGVFPRYDDPLLAEAGLVIVQGDDPATQKRYDRFRDRVMFPIRDTKGEIIGFGGRVLDQGEPKYLNSPETPVFIKGRELYGLFEARQGLRDKGYALVTEGYMDVVALAQLGFPNAVATLGTACTADHVHKLLRFTERVVFSFDGDAAGRRAAGRALEAALPHATDTRSFRFLFLPVEHDPDSYIREFGADAFEQYVQRAIPLSQQLMELAQVDCDMETVEGRAKMLAQARPLWSALPDGALKRQLLGELAVKGHLPVDDLARLWEGGGMRPRRASAGARALEGEDRAPHGDAGDPDGPAVDVHGEPGGEPRPRRREWSEGRGGRGGYGGGKWRGRDRDHDPTAAPPSTPRTAPKTAQDRAVQMLFGHPEWWDRLSPDEHELMHGLPGAHGPLVAWLERDLAEHGPRPWAALKVLMHEDETFDDTDRRLADGDADPDATFEDFRRAVDVLLLAKLGADAEAIVPFAESDPSALRQLGAIRQHAKEVRDRMNAAKSED
jgi:DNA primase